MSERQPHKAEVLAIVKEDEFAVHFMVGYLVGQVHDDVLCDAIRNWRSHQARIADLMQAKELENGNATYDPRD